MTQKEKDLLLKDLCARLPYGVRVKLNGRKETSNKLTIDWLYTYSRHIEDIKLYLRPMSSMTEEEIEEFSYRVFQQPDLNMVKEWKTLIIDGNQLSNAVDFLNERMFDWRKIKRDNKYISMIKAGLALEAPKGMYNY